MREVGWRALLLSIAVGLAVALCPIPEGLTRQAWNLLAIFMGTITAIITKPLPLGATAVVALTVATFSKTLTFSEAFASYSQDVLWLILIAFFIAKGFMVTGLGRRVAYLFVALLGKKTIGLGYGLVASDLLLAPAIPSVTARSGGVVFPILLSLAQAFDSLPHDASARKMGTYLTLTAFHTTVISSAMFVTAMAANPLVVRLAAEAGIALSWAAWAKAALIPGAVSLLVTPLILYWLYPPEVKATPHAPQLARQYLREMGPLSLKEGIMLGVFLLLVTLWVLGEMLGVNATVAALVGLSLLLLGGVLKWRELLQDEGAWETYVWFGALVMLAGKLNQMGVVGWFSSVMMHWVGGLSWEVGLVVLALLYFYSHYFFASSLAHVGAMYGGFLAIATGLGAPPLLTALVLGFFSSLFGCLTHYGFGPAPLLYGAGYVSLRQWWVAGAVVSLSHVLIWSFIGGLWWKLLGLW